MSADAATDPQQATATSLSVQPRADMWLERESALVADRTGAMHAIVYRAATNLLCLFGDSDTLIKGV